ncbi:MAG: AmpG family muropeptide MFS transporter [Syntrophaceae bacterium]
MGRQNSLNQDSPPGIQSVQSESSSPGRSPWLWVPSLYFTEGLPYVIAMTISVVMYKRLGISNTEIALYTSWLYLPWVIKPLWSPFVEMYGRKRSWILLMQLVIGASLACIALTVPAGRFFQYTLAFFWLMAFSSATHDIAADGFYMLGLRQDLQAAFVGVRTLFYRVATIAAQGGLVILAGQMEGANGIVRAWSVSFFACAIVFLLLCGYHFLVLPRPALDRPAPQSSRNLLSEYLRIISLYFQRKDIIAVLAFFLFYRFAESQLVKLIAPFLLDPRTAGGLGLTTSEVGFAYGTVGIIALSAGGLLGGYVIYRNGLKFWLWPMVFAMHLPDLAFVYLSQAMPQSLLLINCAIAVEQFGYGFGFTAYTMYMIMISEGDYRTVFYAISTGFMALGMMVPGMFSGWLQESMGYGNFFLWIVISTIPGFVVPALVRIDPGYGRRQTPSER